MRKKCAVCVAVELEPANGTYYYKVINNDSKYFLFYNLIKKVDFHVKEYKENMFLSREEVIKNDDDDQRRRRIKLMEREDEERRQKSEK